MDGPPREDRALAILMGACLVIFIAQWPRLSREAFVTDGLELNALLAGALFGWLFVAPLFLYGLALASHLVAKALGGQGTSFGARMALFWALLAAAPLWLLTGLTAGFIGPGTALNALGIIAFTAFVFFWLAGLAEAGWPEEKVNA